MKCLAAELSLVTGWARPGSPIWTRTHTFPSINLSKWQWEVYCESDWRVQIIGRRTWRGTTCWIRGIWLSLDWPVWEDRNRGLTGEKTISKQWVSQVKTVLYYLVANPNPYCKNPCRRVPIKPYLSLGPSIWYKEATLHTVDRTTSQTNNSLFKCINDASKRTGPGSCQFVSYTITHSLVGYMNKLVLLYNVEFKMQTSQIFYDHAHMDGTSQCFLNNLIMSVQ